MAASVIYQLGESMAMTSVKSGLLTKSVSSRLLGLKDDLVITDESLLARPVTSSALPLQPVKGVSNGVSPQQST
jgi:hypothetical protein